MEESKRNVIALGFFDGVHLGHQALLRRAAERAEALGMAPAMFTFDRSPREFVTGRPVPLLTTAEERREKVRTLFPDMEVIVAPFDREMMTMPWVDFVLLLAREYRAGWLVAGHDYRFGHKNAGTPALLMKKAAQLGMGCDIIPAVTLDGITVSSTYIRALLERGDVEEAARFLGGPFALTGRVRHGRGLGSRLGAPTLNVIPQPEQALPANGVYVTRVLSGERTYGAVTNVGVRPTVEEGGGITVESHLLDQDLQLYGSLCRVEFLTHIRPERRFEDLEALRRQIAADADAARRAEVSLEQHVTQDTPPAFLWHTYTDPGVPVENTMLFAMALRRAGVPFESHIYSVGGHGLSLANELTENTAGAGVQAECTGWVDLAAGWLRR